MLYQQLSNAHGRANKQAIGNLLLSLKAIPEKQAKLKGCDAILIDTSPYYAGGTHLAWTAADISQECSSCPSAWQRLCGRSPPAASC